MTAIKVEKLTKKFDAFIAVNNISFEIKIGEIFGLLGPNGAGKTTTLSMLCTLLKPTSGKATVNGFDIVNDPDNVRKSIGIVFQDQSLDEELTAYENMDFHGRLYRIPKSERKGKITELLNLVELDSRKDDLVKTFSGGMRRRLEIARGLLHEPKILFLDEPTLGLDPQTRNHLWEYIKRLNEEKSITIIITTHYMDEADRLCHNMVIIDHGKIIVQGTPAKLKEKIGGDIVTIESSDNDKLAELLKTFPWVKDSKKFNHSLNVNLLHAEIHIADIIQLADKNNLLINSLAIHKPTLEDVFLHYTGKTIREEEASPMDNMRLKVRMWRR
jgi:ABC-2 type transport system ATP-binding protein